MSDMPTYKGDDALDEAMSAQWKPFDKTYFGKLIVKTYDVVLIAGKGRVPFDPTQHKPEQKRLAIDMILSPVPGPNGPVSYNIERKMIAQSQEWVKIVRPSLEKLGVNLRYVNGKWPQVTLVKTGGSYTRVDQETGESQLKELTTFRFDAVYQSEREAIDAANIFFSNRGNNNGQVHTAQPAVDADFERQTAAKFLPTFWTLAKGDEAAFFRLIADSEVTAKYFNQDSPEVQEIMLPH